MEYYLGLCFSIFLLLDVAYRLADGCFEFYPSIMFAIFLKLNFMFKFLVSIEMA